MWRLSMEKKTNKMKWWMYALIILGVIILVYTLTFGIPIIINELYRNNDGYITLWGAEDVLGYYGEALGFLGTVVFSALALWQNHRIQEANDKHTKLLEEMERKKNEPFIFVKSSVAYGNASRLRLTIQNISDNLAEKLQASGFRIEDETGKILWQDNDIIRNEYLLSKTTWELQWENPQVTSNKHKFIFDIKYQDVFNKEYNCFAVGVFEDKITIPKFTVFLKNN